MDYFVGSINGNWSKYERAVSILKPYDNIYFLGNLIDGEDPAESVRILMDIMNRKDAHLIIGQHEIAHFYYQYALFTDDETNISVWSAYLESLEPSPMPLVSYMDTLGNGKNEILAYLRSQPVTKMLKIGKMYFYLTHGFPIPPAEDINDFNIDVTSSIILEGEFISRIKADLSLQPDEDSTEEDRKEYREWTKNISNNNTLVVCASQPVEDFGYEYETNGVINRNGIILVGSSMESEKVAVLAIDAGGYKTFYL